MTPVRRIEVNIDNPSLARVAFLVLTAAMLAGCAGGVNARVQPSTRGDSTGSSSASARDGAPSSAPAWSFHCTPAAGQGCSAPHPIKDDLVGSISVDESGRSISGRFRCGGALTAQVKGSQIALTFRQQLMKPGAMACAMELLTVALPSPLHGRVVVDALTGAVLPITAQPSAAS